MEQVETTARAMCRADGHDPDETVAVPGVPQGSPGEGPAPAATVPRWRAYEPQARRLVAMQTDLLAGG